VDGKDGYTPIKGIDYFDGQNGKDGYTPVKGVDYFDGKDGAPGKDGADGKPGADGNDYVLTEADKKEIAEQAAEMVEVPSGGGDAEWKKEIITLSEPVSVVEITIPSAKKVLVYAKMIANDSANSLTTGSTKVVFTVNGKYASYFTVYIRNNTAYYTFIDVEKVSSKTRVYRSAVFENGLSYSNSTSMNICGWLNSEGDKKETIDKIGFILSEEKYVLQTACKLEVYYK
jgi:hypothetical protein